MNSELFDMSDFGSFYAPAESVRLLARLVAPEPGEKALAIGFDPAVMKEVGGDHSQWQAVKNQPQSEVTHDVQGPFDAIICAPIFGLTLDKTSGGTGETHEEYWLKWSIAHLKETGRLAIIVPAGMLSNYSQSQIRSYLVDEVGLRAVIELPSGWAHGTATQACILLITHDRPPTTAMFRFDDVGAIPWDELPSQVISPEPTLPGGTAGKAYAVQRSALSNLRLDPRYYDPVYTDVEVPEPSEYAAVKLSDIVEIRSGERFTKEAVVAEGIPFVQVANVTTDGRLDLRNVRSIKETEARTSRAYSIPGDVLITIAGTVGKVALVGDGLPSVGVCIDTSLRRLTLRDDVQVLPEYLALYLRSDLAQRQIERALSGSVIAVLSSPNLGDMTVYLPSLERQGQVVKAFRQMLKGQEAKILTGFPDADKMAASLLAADTAVQPVMHQASLSLEPPPAELSWRDIVRTLLPFPVAHAYSGFGATGTESYSSQLKSLIDVSEAVVYYLYGVCVSDQLRRLKSADPELKAVTDFQIDRRISFIMRLIKLAKQGAVTDLFVPEIVDAEVGVCREINNNVRNIQAHLSALPEPRCRQLVESYRPKLERLLQSLLPLRQYKLAVVRNIEVRNRRPQYTILSMMGESPLFRAQVEDLDDFLEADTQQVLLIDQNYNSLVLHPFYILHAWESTGMHPHLCFFKQVIGDPPKQRLKVASTQSSVEVITDTDLDLSALII
jgi:Type I restriction modification DNA specificity domain/N-6 DNA Methylase